MRDEDRYLQQRGRRWHYVRRVPEHCAVDDDRGMIRKSLKTTDKKVARERRDGMEAADDLFWAALVAGEAEGAHARYESAVRRARSLGFTYAPADELARDTPLEAILDRVEAVWSGNGAARPDVEAGLGGVERPRVTVRQALDVYFDQITPDEVKHKSPAQRKSWKKVKHRAVNNFIVQVGDLVMEDISRAHAQSFHGWLQDRTTASDRSERISGSTANRDFGNMRKLYAQYFRYIGDEERPNPFRNLSFDDSQQREIPPFEADWISGKILAPAALDGLNREARLIVYALIETGCRPSEICNLPADPIRWDGEVPFISIEPTDARQLKTKSSKRQIPLLGISLAALQAAPEGFPRYRDKETNLSGTLQKWFRDHGLFPGPNHRVYSFRHSFEKRMAEAGLDYGLRCLLMGHATDRPAYGDGGSMSYRRDELAKIALAFDPALIEGVGERG